jgi:hypothetical protein
MNIELDNKVKEIWNEKLSNEDKIKILAKFQFWDGFKNHYFEYLPEPLKEMLRCTIEDNKPILP